MQNIFTEIKKAIASQISFRFLYGIGILIAAFFIFSAGVTVGFHKAYFGRAWQEHYGENFGPGYGNTRFLGIGAKMPDYFPNAHGVIGKIIKTGPEGMIVIDKSGMEKMIFFNEGVEVQKGGSRIQISDLNIDDFVVVIGSSDDKGVIQAKFARILPHP